MNTIIFLTIEIILFVFSVILIKKHVPEAKQPFKKILSSLAPIIVILALFIIFLIMEMKNTSFIDYDNKSLICSLIIFIILIITFILWILFGKNNKEKLETVEYYKAANCVEWCKLYKRRYIPKRLVVKFKVNVETDNQC